MEKNNLRKATSEIRKNTWYEAIIARNASGLTIRDWCRENGVNETSYYYWLKKIRIETLEVHDTKKEANLTFVPMLQVAPISETVVQEQGSNQTVEAEMTIASKGITISLGKGTSADFVINILKVLKDA